VTITADETTFSKAEAMVPERPGLGLPGWIHARDVRPAFHMLPVTSPAGVEDFAAACHARRATIPPTPAIAPGGQFIQGPTAQLAQRIAAMQATDQYRTQYEPFGAAFAAVRIADLITPQWWTDTAYVDELAAAVPADGDLDGLFDFCFPQAQLLPPMMIGGNGAVFASSRHDLGPPSPLRIARRTADKVTFEFDVAPRANWTWLAAVACLPRPVIVNGTHHLLALLKAGRQEALCLMFQVQTPIDLQVVGMNYQDPFLFKPDQLMSARPPLLRDYLDTAAAAPIGRHASDQSLRLAVNFEFGAVPRGW
jgi:hypothetical protein